MRRMITIPATVGIMTLALFASGPASALPSHAYYRIYYFDAAHASYAGSRSMGCSASYNADGVMTQYVETVLEVECTTPYDCEPAEIDGHTICLGG